MAFLSVPAVIQRPKSSYVIPCATSKCAPNPYYHSSTSSVRQRHQRPCRMSATGGSSTSGDGGGTTLGTTNSSSSISNRDLTDVKDIDVEEDGLVVNVIGADYDLMVQEKGKKKVRARTRKLLDEIDRPEDPDNIFTADAADLPPVAEDETMPWVRTAIRAGDERKAIDPIVIRVANISYITSFIVALTGRSEPQMRAIANLVEQNMLKEHGIAPKRKSNTRDESGWVLLDYGDMLVNVFLPDQRSFYNLEKLWKDGEPVDISDCLANGPRQDDTESDTPKSDSLDDWIS